MMRTRNEQEAMSAHDANKVASVYENFTPHIARFLRILESVALRIELIAFTASAIYSIYTSPAST